MKKLIFLIIILSTSFSYSQIIRDYGIKLGGTISNLKWDYNSSIGLSDFNADNKLGINFGIFAESRDISVFRIVAELNYIQKGTKKDIPITTIENPDGTGETLLWEVGLNYLNISFLLKPNINLKFLKPYFIIGPRIDIELSQSIKRDNPKYYEEFSTNNLGLKIGGGSEFTILKNRILLEFIYDNDFKKLYKNQNVEIYSSSYDFRIGIFL